MNLESFPRELITTLASFDEMIEDDIVDAINKLPFGSRANLFSGGYVNAIGTESRLIITEIMDEGIKLIEACVANTLTQCLTHDMEHRPDALFGDDDFCPGCKDEALSEREWDGMFG